jgi:hypothetical protein
MTANVNAGRCVNGSDATCSGIGLGSFATSTIERNFIGADAWSINHDSGNVTGGDGGVATGVSGVAAGLVPDEGEGVGGRVT